jgi:uncharacterized protein (TIGR00251 family)
VIQSISNAIIITVRVIPRAGTSRVDGTRGEALLVRLHAPPIEGAANEELIDVIAEALEVPKRAVSIASGARSRQKRVRVAGIDAAAAAARLALRLADARSGQASAERR